MKPKRYPTPPAGYERLRPSKHRESFIFVLREIEDSALCQLYPESVLIWLESVYANPSLEKFTFPRPLYEHDPVWSIIHDLCDPNWMSRLGHPEFAHTVAKLLGQLTWRRNHRQETGDTPAQLRDQSLVVRRTIMHAAALRWPEAVLSMQGKSGISDPARTTPSSLLRDPSFRLAIPRFAGECIQFEIATESYVFRYESNLRKLFTRKAWSSVHDEDDEPGPIGDCLGSFIDEFPLLLDTPETIPYETAGGNIEKVIGRGAAIIATWGAMTGTMAQSCRSLPLAARFLMAVQKLDPATMTEVEMGCALAGGLAFLYGVPLVDAVNICLMDAAYETELSNPGACAPGYLSLAPCPRYVAAIGSDYYPFAKDRYAAVQFLGFPLPPPFDLFLAEWHQRAGLGDPLIKLIGSTAMDVLKDQLITFCGADSSRFPVRTLHRAFEYVALISTATPVSVVELITGRPLVDWRAATNYFQQDSVGLFSAWQHIVDYLYGLANLSLCLPSPQFELNNTFGASCRPWPEEVDNFRALANRATTENEFCALWRHVLALLGGRHRVRHLHPCDVFRLHPEPHLRISDKAATTLRFRNIPVPEHLEMLLQSMAPSARPEGEIGYATGTGEVLPWSALPSEQRLALAPYARSDDGGTSIRKSFFSYCQAAGAGEVIMKAIFGHGFDDLGADGYQAIFPQGLLLSGINVLFEEFFKSTCLNESLDRITAHFNSMAAIPRVPTRAADSDSESGKTGLLRPKSVASTLEDHRLLESVLLGLGSEEVLSPEATMQTCQAMLAIELSLITGSMTWVRRWSRYLSGHSFAETKDSNELFLIAPLGQSNGQIGLVPIPIERVTAMRLRKLVPFLQQHLALKYAKGGVSDESTCVDSLSLFTDFVVGQRDVGRTLMGCFKTGLAHNGNAESAVVPSIKHLFTAFCRSLRDTASASLPNHVLASIAGSHFHPVEYFSITDLLACAIGPMPFLQTLQGSQWRLPCQPAHRRAVSWRKGKELATAAQHYDLMLDTTGWKGTFVPGWRLRDDVIKSIVCRFIEAPTFRMLRKWICSENILFESELRRLLPAAWYDIRARLIEGAAEAKRESNLDAGLPENHPSDVESLVSSLNAAGLSELEIHQTVTNIGRLVWESLDPEQRKALGKRQAGLIVGWLRRNGLATCAQPLRLLRPEETRPFLEEVDAVIDRSRLSGGERREAKIMVRFAALLGMRVEDICRIYVGDIKSETVLEIFGAKTDAAHRFANLELWGGDSIGEILKGEVIQFFRDQRRGGLTKSLFPALAESHGREPDEKVHHGRRSIPSPKKLSKLLEGFLKRGFKNFCLRTGRTVPDGDPLKEGTFTAHDLRHAAVFRLIQNAFDKTFWTGSFLVLLATISREIGHVCCQTTQCGYLGTAWFALKLPVAPWQQPAKTAQAPT